MQVKCLFQLCVLIPYIAWHVQGTKHSEFINQQIWRLRVDSKAGADTLFELYQNGLIDIVKINESDTHFRVFPESKDIVKLKLKTQSYQPVIEVQDLAMHLQDADDRDKLFGEKERQATTTTTCTQSNCTQPLTNAYMTFQQIEWFLQSLASNYPALVQLTSLGKTHEGRDIWLATVNSSSTVANKSIWIEGGIHAREWIAPAVTLQLLYNLVQNESLVAGITYYFVPMANPDGYVYTKINRLWRKNRANTTSRNCPGVDLNRNWNFHWGVGASSNPCSEVYRGSAPFSQPETMVMSRAMAKIGNLRMVLTIHSYSQVLLYSWGWTAVAAPDTTAMSSLGTNFVNVVFSVNGKKYKCANSATGLYYASGTTDDWAKGALAVKYSYTLELSDTGSYGFLLPASQIAPSGKEIWAGFQVMISKIKLES